MEKKVAIIEVGDQGTSGKDVYFDLSKFVQRALSLMDIDSDIIKSTSGINGYTHVMFMAEGMCDLASEIKKENPEKKVILFITGDASDKECMDYVIPVRKGKPDMLQGILDAMNQ